MANATNASASGGIHVEIYKEGERFVQFVPKANG